MINNLPVRKNLRLNNYDYSRNGCYFITICVTDRCEMLGRTDVGAASCRPRILLSDYGNIVLKWIPNISVKYSDVTIDNYIIMPNHVYMIISIEHGRQNAAPTASESIGTIMGYFKYQTTKEINIPGFWQRSYHDHIIRNHDEYKKIFNYINENPERWAEDRYFNIQ